MNLQETLSAALGKSQQQLLPELIREKLSRDLSTRHLIPFTQYTMPKYEVGMHSQLIATELEAVERREIDRLMIFVPPRHGKSELGSKRFPAWWLGRNPTDQIISATYNAELATDVGEAVRDIIDQEEYHALFSTTLKRDARAKTRWRTSKGGFYVSVGVGQAATGRGAHLFLIDDPLKDDESAQSESTRERIWNWYSSVAYTRLMPKGAIVLIMTRWHEDDLAGRLLDRMKNTPGADQWKVVDLAAIDEARMDRKYTIVPAVLPPKGYCTGLVEAAVTASVKGIKSSSGLENVIAGKFTIPPQEISFPTKVVWEAWWPETKLLRIKQNIVERHWSALYQQRPMPDEGIYFKRKWARFWVADATQAEGDIHRYKVLPKSTELRFYGASDYATDEDKKADFTVHGIFAVDHAGNVYVIHVWRGQKTSKVWVDELISLMERFHPLMWFEEQGQIIKALTPFITEMMEEHKLFTHRKALPSVTSKQARARTLQGWMEKGRVFFPLYADWLDDFLHEFFTFPAGKNDDQVDMASLMLRGINRLIKGAKPSADDVNDPLRGLNNGMKMLTLDECWKDRQRRDRSNDAVDIDL